MNIIEPTQSINITNLTNEKPNPLATNDTQQTTPREKNLHPPKLRYQSGPNKQILDLPISGPLQVMQRTHV